MPAWSQAFEVPQGRCSDDAVVWTVADFDKHAYEMGTSELHRTSIMLAAARGDHEPKHLPQGSQPKAATEAGAGTKNIKEPLWRINCFERNGLTGTPPLPKS